MLAIVRQIISVRGVSSVGEAVEVWEWMSDLILHFIMEVITSP